MEIECDGVKAMEEKLIQSFTQQLLADGKFPKTVESYTSDVTGFLQWLKGKGQNFDGNLKRFYVTAYRDHLLKNGYHVTTINKKINSLQSFNRYLVSQGYTKEIAVELTRDKVKTATGSEREVEVFKEEDVEKILFHIQDQTKVSTRDKTIITILLYTGVRASEVINIKVKDIDFLTMQLKVLGKGGKYREIPLKPEVTEAIREYLGTERKESKYNQSEYLLLTQRAEKCHRDTINRLLRKIGHQLKLPINPHKFRHTMLSRLIKKGVPITTVSQIAGHANIQTTANHYINTSRQDKIKAINLL